MESRMTQHKNDNNFNFVRLTACLFVFVGHMGVLMGMDPPRFCGFRMHETGVSILFILAGFLITQSWCKDPDPLRYAIRRFLRLWPPFAVMILLMTFVAGPLVSELGSGEYFRSGFTSYLKNLRFYITYAQPGVFTDVPVSNATNGSLWTMPVEAAMYVLTPVIAAVFSIYRRDDRSFRAMAVFTGLLYLAGVYIHVFCEDARVVVYAVSLVPAFHLAFFYAAGILFTYPQMQRLLNLQRGCAGTVLLMMLSLGPGPLQYSLRDLILPYLVFSIALAPKPVFRNLCRRFEPSYGIYLYGFFFQQLVVQMQLHRGSQAGFLTTLIKAGLPTLAAAAVSFYLIEKPMLRLSHILTGKLSKSSGTKL